jgi:hypothetical protein
MGETREQALYRLRPPLTEWSWEGWDGSQKRMRQLASLQFQDYGSYKALATEYEARISALEAQIECGKEALTCLSKRGLWPRLVAYWKGCP